MCIEKKKKGKPYDGKEDGAPLTGLSRKKGSSSKREHMKINIVAGIGTPAKKSENGVVADVRKRGRIHRPREAGQGRPY